VADKYGFQEDEKVRKARIKATKEVLKREAKLHSKAIRDVIEAFCKSQNLNAHVDMDFT
jgi:hypothetical protein